MEIVPVRNMFITGTDLNKLRTTWEDWIHWKYHALRFGEYFCFMYLRPGCSAPHIILDGDSTGIGAYKKICHFLKMLEKYEGV